MGQIVGGSAKTKRCNIRQLSQLGTPAAGDYILVSSDNSMNAAGQGNFDCYIEGNGTKAADELELKNVDNGTYKEVFGYTETLYEEQPLIENRFLNTNRSSIPLPSALPELNGTYCAYLNVQEGEKYRIYGNGPTVTVQLYTLADSTRTLVSRSGNVSARDTGVIVEIPAGVAYLIVNLYNYDASTDKVEKIVESHVEGLADKVEHLDDKVEEVAGNEVTRYIEQDLQEDKYYQTRGTQMYSAQPLEGTNCCAIWVEEGEKFRIYGNGPTDAVQLYVIADSEQHVILKSGRVEARNTGVIVEIPAGASILYVNLYNYDASTDKVEKITTETVGGVYDYVEERTKSLLGKTIVCFGDSITEFAYQGKRYADYIAEFTGANVICVGIGGTQIRRRATPTQSPSSDVEAYAALDIVSMIDASCAQSFSMQIAAAEYLKNNANDDNTKIVEVLSEIDWGNVSAVTILGGTNDWNNASSYWGDETSTDLGTTFGAVRHIIETLLTTYPHIQLYWLSPLVRWINYTNGTGEAANWSDVATRNGKTLGEFKEMLSEIVKQYHTPFFDLYNELGWNKYNFSKYFLPTDGTHPYLGFGYLGRKIASYLIANSSII